MTASDDDRIAYLAGEDVPSLSADEAAELDVLRAELGAAAVWDEPPAGLEDQVVRAVTEAAVAAPRPRRLRGTPSTKHNSARRRRRGGPGCAGGCRSAVQPSPCRCRWRPLPRWPSCS